MKHDLTQRLSEGLSVPQEAIGEVSLAELRGKRSVSIENHRGITQYTQEQIRVAVKQGAISVLGHDLSIVCMNRKRLEIRGTIQSVELE